MNLYGKNNQFNEHVGLVGKILTDNSIHFAFVDKIPSGALACFNRKQNTVYLPAIDPNKLTEIEARKIMGYSAHERKHVKLTHPNALDGLNKEIEESNKKGIKRKVLNSLWQTIEDLRIEMNENYSYPGDMLDIKYVNDCLFEEYKNAIAFPLANPIGYVLECMRYQMLSQHPAFPRVEFFPIYPIHEPYYNAAMTIMNDGRFTKSLSKGIESSYITLELTLDIEKAWIEINKDQNKNQDDKESLEEKFEKGQKEYKVSENPLIDAINEICDQIEKSEKENSNNNPERYGSEFGKYVSYGKNDQIIIASPEKTKFDYVKNKVGPTISIIRDKIAIQLKTLSENRTVHGLRKGNIDHSRLYKTAFGCKKVMKKTYYGLDYSSAIQIVIDLSGSMYYGSPLSRSNQSMQMSIILAEVFQLLKIPFEITGFNTGSDNNEKIPYEGSKNITFRTEQVNYHIFKGFSDDYSLDSVKHRLGSIQPDGCNIDHEVILWSAARLYKRPEKRKLQIILSDGQPSGNHGSYNGLLNSELKKANNKIRNNGIQQFAFGLQSHYVSKFYKDYVVLEKLEELNSTALNIFVDFLMKGINNKNRMC